MAMFDAITENPIMQNALGTIIAAAVIGGATLLWGVYTQHHQRSSREKTFAEIKSRKYRNPFVLFILELMLLQILWSGAVLFITLLNKSTDLSEAEIMEMPADLLVFFGLLAIAVGIVSVFVAHRVRTKPIVWNMCLLGAAFIFLMIELSILAQEPPPVKDFLAFVGLTTVILVPATLIGSEIARRTQQVFVLKQLYKRLPSGDRKALIDLIDTLPSMTDKTKR